jgi:hypothetical protein
MSLLPNFPKMLSLLNHPVQTHTDICLYVGLTKHLGPRAEAKKMAMLLQPLLGAWRQPEIASPKVGALHLLTLI